MGAIEVLRPGLLTTVQDLGRWGWQAWGVSVSGPMDPPSHRRANLLVGNPDRAATLEITATGPELRFEDERVIAVTGASFVLDVDGQPVPASAGVRVNRGGRLRFGRRLSGTRAYLAVSGGIAVDPVFGSRSTHVPSRLGGFRGRALASGDRLPLGPDTGPPPSPGATPVDVPLTLPLKSGRARIRVLPSPHPTRFRADALDRLQSGPYRVGPQSDRMGYRLEGPRLHASVAGSQLSEPSPAGSIQVPPGGDPILLMADCQTVGGYPVVATVIAADRGLAGQLGPGDALTFTVCTRQEAVSALIALERTLMGPR
ncbi:MAG: biotin-dependent carboxyltransferase family protein [Vicinamibacterales bacterium]